VLDVKTGCVAHAFAALLVRSEGTQPFHATHTNHIFGINPLLADTKHWSAQVLDAITHSNLPSLERWQGKPPSNFLLFNCQLNIVW
jgi:hypothetical protein